MANTINYSEMAQAVMSFMTISPKWYLNFGDKLFSFDSSNVLRLHNSNARFNVLSSVPGVDKGGNPVEEPADNSIIKLIVNSDYDATKVFDNVSYPADFGQDKNFGGIFFKTNTQTSKSVDYIARREDSYMFSIPRQNSQGSFSARMRGRYLISNLTYYDHTGNKFTIPYIKTTYRYSMA